MKGIGGLTALYGGYELATQNREEISVSFGDVFECLEGGGDGYEAALELYDSTREQIRESPDYGENLGTALTGLAAATVGSYIDGDWKLSDIDRYRLDGDVA